MPATHLLDTSVYSQPLRRAPHAAAMNRWANLGDSSLVICTICEAEVLFGIEKSRATRQAKLFQTALQNRLQILPICSATAANYAQFRADCEHKGRMVADMDLLIAAAAHTHNLIVATLNLRHFGMIDGLRVEDWS